MKRFVLASVGLLAMFVGVTAASAADLPRRHAMPMKAPAYAAPYNWTGAYVGINGGGAWGDANWSALGTGDFRTSGGLVGATLGYNWQAGPTVFGLETDIDWANIKGSTTNGCGGVTCATKNDWLGTTRGRIGYAFNRFLPFVTGGAAYGDVKSNFGGFTSDNDTRLGWTVGAGLEVGLVGPWSVKAEYLYADLGKSSCPAASCGAATDVRFTSNIVRGGLNYRF
jgi:outer membrane immunogenic protein